MKRQLQSLNQGNKSCSEYLRTAKHWANQLAAIGKPTDDKDLISFVISGLNPSFNLFVTFISIAIRDNPLSFINFQDELLNHEMLINQQQIANNDAHNFALFVQRKGNDPSNPCYQNYNHKGKAPMLNRFSPRPSQYRGPPHVLGTNGSALRITPTSNQPPHGPAPQQFSTPARNDFPSSQPSPRVPCQIYGKSSHQALDCFHRMDYAYQGRHPSSQLAAMVAQTNNTLEEQPWFANSGANAHITSELENLSIQPQPFQGP